ncbi:MAG: DUF6785 family protein [Thermoproteota archaeon]
MGEREVITKPGIKTWIIVLALIFPPIFFFLNMPLHSMTQWWVWPAWFPIHFFWFLLLFHYLGKISPKLKLGPTEVVLILTIFYLVSGKEYLYEGIHNWTEFPLWTFNSGLFYYGAYNPTSSDVFWSKVPSFLLPARTALKAFYEGGFFDLSAWLAPALFWTLWSIAVFAGGMFWAYILRKPLVEVERVPFPFSAPAAYMIKYYYEGEEKGGLTARTLFNLKTKTGKILWLGFIIGFIMLMPASFQAFLPIPLPTYLQVLPIYDWFMPIVEKILPGAYVGGWFPPIDILILLLVPTDILLTGTLYYIIFGIIYPVIGVAAGILPWSPGYDPSAYATYVGPWNSGWFGMVGISVGLGIWLLWNYRSHFAKVLSSLTSKEKLEDEGMPYSWIATGSIATFVLLLVLWIAAGGNPIMGILGIIFYIVFLYGWVYESAIAYPTSVTNTPYGIPVFYTMGNALGQWGPWPDQRSFMDVALFWTLGGPGSRQSAFQMHSQFLLYGVGRENKVRARDILIVSVITMISIAFTVQFLTPWWYTVFGGKNNLGAVDYNEWSFGDAWNYSYGTPGGIPSQLMILLYVILGIITTFAMFILRARFAWFPLHPVGIAMVTTWGIAHGTLFTVAFIVKYLFLKLGGSRSIEEIGIPLAVGATIGAGTAYGLATLLAFVTRAIPVFLTYL